MSGRANLFLLTCVLTCRSIWAEEHQTRVFPPLDENESVVKYSERVGVPSTKTIELGNGIKIYLVLIPPGKFMMGTVDPKEPSRTDVFGKVITGCGIVCILAIGVWYAIRWRASGRVSSFSLRFLIGISFVVALILYGIVDWIYISDKWAKYYVEHDRAKWADSNERPARVCEIRKPFYMSRTEITQEQYYEITGSNPSTFIGKSLPVETVSWTEAHDYCVKVTAATKISIRLPNETEWEYSCRSGMQTNYYSGDSEADLKRVGWYCDNSNYATHPVSQKEANAFGLFDMHGNVWEWCEDWYRNDSSGEEGIAPSNTFRVIRGGSMNMEAKGCRSASRAGTNGPDDRHYSIGFRIITDCN